MLTHYFAIFVFVVEGAWLVWDRRRRGLELRPAITAAAPAFLAVVALVPLAVSQGAGDSSGRADWISAMSLPARVVAIPATFLTGFESPRPVLVAGIACLLVVPALWMIVRGLHDGFLRVAPAAGVALAGVALPLLAALAGSDYLLYRNVIGLLAPVLVALGAGFAAAAALGRLSLAVLCGLSIFVLAATAWQPKFDKEDWRSAAAAIGATAEPRAIVATPGSHSSAPLAVYAGTRRLEAGGAAVREVDVLASAHRPLGSTDSPTVPRPLTAPPPAPGFVQTERRVGDRWTLIVFRAARRVRLDPAMLAHAKLDPSVGARVLLQEPHRNILGP